MSGPPISRWPSTCRARRSAVRRSPSTRPTARSRPVNSQVKSISSARSWPRWTSRQCRWTAMRPMMSSRRWPGRPRRPGSRCWCSPATGTASNWSTTPARFYIRSAGSRTCRGWTQPRSRHVSVCRRRSIPTTLLCAVTRRTICPESPAWGRRRRRNGSDSSVRWTNSSPMSMKCRARWGRHFATTSAR